MLKVSKVKQDDALKLVIVFLEADVMIIKL
jgi:hypothetical protein